MDAVQLPLSSLNEVPVEGIEGFVVVSGNDMETARGAAAIARATGSVGAKEFHQQAYTNVISKFAIVKRI